MEDTKKIEQPNSCEIAINAKGQFSGKIKVYAETIEKAMDTAKTKSEELAEFIELKNKVE